MNPLNTSLLRLGKHPAKHDAKRLKLARYFAPAMPAAPVAVDWLKGRTAFGLMGNATLSDCTIAAVIHAEQVISMNVDKELTFTEQDAIDYYSKWCGYVPGVPETDNGGVEVDVLNSWRKDKIKGHALLGYADPDPGNVEQVKLSIALFGGIYIGLQLPLSAQSQVVWDLRGSTIDPPNQPGSWGGHAVFVAAFDAEGLTCITWGGTKKMTWAFWKNYCDEAHAILLGYWLRAGASPAAQVFGNDGIDEKFRYDEMKADVARIVAA